MPHILFCAGGGAKYEVLPLSDTYTLYKHTRQTVTCGSRTSAAVSYGMGWMELEWGQINRPEQTT